MHHPTDRIAHTTAFVTPVVEHWLEREIAQWVYPTKDRSDDPSHHERTLLPRSYISLPVVFFVAIVIVTAAGFFVTSFFFFSFFCRPMECMCGIYMCLYMCSGAATVNEYLTTHRRINNLRLNLRSNAVLIICPMQWRIQTFYLGGTHVLRLNAKGTVGSFGGRKLIYSKIITLNINTHTPHQPTPPHPLSASALSEKNHLQTNNKVLEVDLQFDNLRLSKQFHSYIV